MSYATNILQQDNAICSLDALVDLVLKVNNYAQAITLTNVCFYHTNKSSMVFTVQNGHYTLGVQPTQSLTTLWSCNSPATNK